MSPRSWIVCSMAAVLLASPAAAQQPGTFEVGGFAQWTWFDENAGAPNAVPENGLGYGGRLGVFLTPKWQIEGDGYYSPQDRKQTEEFCCLGMFPTLVTASAFALRLNYNVPMGMMGGRSHLIFGAGAVRTHYKMEGGNSTDTSTANFGPSGLLGLRLGLAERVALRFDGVADYMPGKEPEANLNLHARAGLSFLLGGREPVVPVAPAPPPPPVRTPPPPPPPPAAPREDAITVCVIDPSASGGIRMQAATYRHAQRDTIVMMNGQTRPLRDAVGNVMVARNAGWYMRGEPLEMMVNRESLRYLPYGSGMVVEPNRIVYVGNVNGYPVYADRDEVADVITAINTARAGRTDAELGTILAAHASARNAIQGAAYLYVPLDPYGCTFQPLALQEDVRKGGK
ncbi:MAG: outer membrane beta-barrel protein [Gemmatimonadetes bacterium]|nr:outer membrane beta-barrel protein [Gemmatimonadota bacterium]